MSPHCTNCGSHVSAEFVRVSLPDDLDELPICPHCPGVPQAGFPDALREVLGQ